jgi:hypothetical protein
MLRREGNLNFKHLLNRFVKEYCGPKWSVDLEVVDYDSYVDGFGDNEDERKESAESNFSDHKRSD